MPLYEEDVLDQKLCDKAQVLAGREYRHLRALMMTGATDEIAMATQRLRQELPQEMAEDFSFENLMRAMQKDVARASEMDIAIEA